MQLVSFIPADASTVAEFGCGEGLTGRMFKQIQPDCRYIGMEGRQGKASQAVKVLDQVCVGTFAEFDFSRMGICPQELDCLVYHGDYAVGDCLADKIKEQAAFLRPQGQVVFDLPNSRYFRNVFALWRGETALYPEVQPLVNVLAVLQAAGLQIYDVQPYYSRDDEALQLQPDIKSLLAAFAACESLPQPKNAAEVWAAGYVLRAVKTEQRPEPLLLQTMVGEQAVCSRVRVVEPQSFLQTIPGVRAVHKFQAADLQIGDAYQKKVFIRQRTWAELPRGIEELKTFLAKGYLTIAEMDDDPLRWREFHEKTKFFAFRGCHAVQVSTPALAEYMRQFNPHVGVFVNQLASLPERRIYDDAAPVTLFFGALNREADWAELMPTINRVLAGYGKQVQVKVIYDQKFFAALETEQKEYIPFCPYDVYAKTLHGADIAILPLKDTRFNRMKSDLKFVECAGHGAAVLASPTVYGDSLHHGSTGLLYRNAEEFAVSLRLLIENTALRHELAENAYAYVKRERLLSQHYKERYVWYDRLLARLPDLSRELLERVDKL